MDDRSVPNKPGQPAHTSTAADATEPMDIGEQLKALMMEIEEAEPGLMTQAGCLKAPPTPPSATPAPAPTPEPAPVPTPEPTPPSVADADAMSDADVVSDAVSDADTDIAAVDESATPPAEAAAPAAPAPGATDEPAVAVNVEEAEPATSSEASVDRLNDQLASLLREARDLQQDSTPEPASTQTVADTEAQEAPEAPIEADSNAGAAIKSAAATEAASAEPEGTIEASAGSGFEPLTGEDRSEQDRTQDREEDRDNDDKSADMSGAFEPTPSVPSTPSAPSAPSLSKPASQADVMADAVAAHAGEHDDDAATQEVIHQIDELLASGADDAVDDVFETSVNVLGDEQVPPSESAAVGVGAGVGAGAEAGAGAGTDQAVAADTTQAAGELEHTNTLHAADALNAPDAAHASDGSNDDQTFLTAEDIGRELDEQPEAQPIGAAEGDADAVGFEDAAGFEDGFEDEIGDASQAMADRAGASGTQGEGDEPEFTEAVAAMGDAPAVAADGSRLLVFQGRLYRICAAVNKPLRMASSDVRHLVGYAALLLLFNGVVLTLFGLVRLVSG